MLLLSINFADINLSAINLERYFSSPTTIVEKSFKLEPSSWTWTGSRVRPNGVLAADELGSILSLQPDPDALSLIEPIIDTSRFGSHVWSKQVPKKNSMVQIFIQPFVTENNAKS